MAQGCAGDFHLNRWASLRAEVTNLGLATDCGSASLRAEGTNLGLATDCGSAPPLHSNLARRARVYFHCELQHLIWANYCEAENMNKEGKRSFSLLCHVSVWELGHLYVCV